MNAPNMEHGPTPEAEKSRNPFRRWPLRSFVVCWGIFLILVVGANQYAGNLNLYNNSLGRCESGEVWHEAQYRSAVSLAKNGVKAATRAENAEAAREMEATKGFEPGGGTDCKAVLHKPSLLP